MAISKNPGPLLTSKFRGIIDVIPLKWRSKLGITSLVQEQPVDVGPHALGDTTSDGVRVVSSVQQDRTDERKKTDVFIANPVGSTMVEYFRTKDGQIGTRTHTVRNEGDTLPSLTELIIEADQEAWGDDLIEQVVSTIPNLLGLYDYRVERPDRVPADFGGLIPIVETSHTVAGQAALPTLATGELMHEERQIDAQTKRITVRSRDLAGLPISITNYETDNDKEVVIIVRTWQLASVAAVAPTATTDTKWEPMGDAIPYTNGTAIQTVATKSVFARPVYAIERADKVPPEFGALLEITESETTSAGTISPPTLTAGELMRREEQVTVFTKRIIIRSRDLASLPISLVSYETDKDKEVVTITRTWQLASIAALLPTATRDASWEPVGDAHPYTAGTAIQTKREKIVFPGPVYSKSIENLIPPRFRAHIKTTVSEITSTGTANPNPTLAIGELSHEEQQIDAFNIRTKSVTLGAISPPVTFTDTELGGEEFGGGILDVIYKLNVTGTYAVDTGLLVIASDVTDLGNGYEILTTKQLQDMVWPTLTEYDQDPETLSLITSVYTVVDASTVTAPSIVTGTITRYKKIDKWRSLQIVETYSLPADYEEQRFMANHFPSLWDYTIYNYSTACGPTGYIREGFSTMVQARVAISFSTSKETITGLTIIPNTHHLVHDIVQAVLNDAGTITYSGTCSGPIFLPASSPDYSTYLGSIQGTEQLITGESVLWRAGLYKNTRLYVTMI